MNTLKNPTVKESKHLPQEPYRFIKRIGSTDFEIAVFFSGRNKETLNDKIKRLLKSETGREVKN